MARSTPAHIRIADEIRRRIDADDYPDDFLPPEVKLAEAFGVSRPTIRVALQHLVNEGLITRQAGSGTRIVRGGSSSFWALGTLTELTGVFKPGEVITMSARIDPAGDHPEVARALQLDPVNGEIYHIHRILSKDGFAYGYSHLFCEPSVQENIPPGELAKSFFVDLVLRYSQRKAVHVRQRVSARLADAEAQQTLSVDPGTPILLIRRTYFSADSQPLMHIEILGRGDRFEQVVDLVQTGASVPPEV